MRRGAASQQFVTVKGEEWTSRDLDADSREVRNGQRAGLGLNRRSIRTAPIL